MKSTAKRFKKSFSLIEMLIAMALFALVMGSLFALFLHNIHIHDELESLQAKSEVIRRAHARLTGVFSKLIYKIEGRHLFYTPAQASSKLTQSKEGASLVFTFDNGLDRARGFSYDVIAKLYVDQENRLALMIWPNPIDEKKKPTEVRNEILLENIESMKMQFWKAPNLGVIVPVDKTGEWLDTWEEDFKGRPTLMKVTLKYVDEAKIEKSPNDKDRELVFCFVASVDTIEPLILE